MKQLRILPIKDYEVTKDKYYIHTIDHISQLKQSTENATDIFNKMSDMLSEIRTRIPRKQKIKNIYGL